MEQKRLPVFSERFYQLRNRESMTQGEFADFLGISRPTVGFYENGSRVPDAIALRQIANKCNVSADWLLGLSDFTNKKQEVNADSLYCKLISLMAIEFDEHDRRRVARSLETIIDGFRAAVPEYATYTYYENAIIRTSLALTTTAQALKWATGISEDNAFSSKDQNDIYHELYEIIFDASATVYKEIGCFFNIYLETIQETLSANDYMSMYQGFASDLDKLKEKWRYSDL